MATQKELVVWWTNPEEPDETWENFNVTKPHLDMATQGWRRLGSVTVSIPSREEIAAFAIEKLREQQRKVRVRAEEACEALEQNIQKFLAIEGPKSVGDGV